MNKLLFQKGPLFLFALLNLTAFLVCGFDKWCAVHGKRRVPERTLLFICVLGGSPAFFLAMHLFRHKTRKPKFYIGVPLILCAQLGLLFYALHIYGWRGLFL